ncbi:hypothetical protein J1614_010570 [Plenodomus biglobosus]|nr:hypothetical protein J1614_010570 [Plenodomus biglobosus]
MATMMATGTCIAHSSVAQTDLAPRRDLSCDDKAWFGGKEVLVGVCDSCVRVLWLPRLDKSLVVWDVIVLLHAGGCESGLPFVLTLLDCCCVTSTGPTGTAVATQHGITGCAG